MRGKAKDYSIYQNSLSDFLGRRYSTLLVILFLSLLLLPASSALTLTFDEPDNITYPYTAGLPINISTVDASTCYFTIDAGVTNTTIYNCYESVFDVNEDSSYTFVVYAENSSDITSAEVNFTTDRGTFGSTPGLIAGFTILFLMSVAFLFIYISKTLSQDFQILSYVFIGLSITFVLFAFRACYIFVREYVKLPILEDLLLSVYNVSFWLFYLVFFVMIILGLFIWAFSKKKNVGGVDNPLR